jgi:hypothetical protein
VHQKKTFTIEGHVEESFVSGKFAANLKLESKTTRSRFYTISSGSSHNASNRITADVELNGRRVKGVLLYIIPKNLEYTVVLGKDVMSAMTKRDYTNSTGSCGVRIVLPTRQPFNLFCASQERVFCLSSPEIHSLLPQVDCLLPPGPKYV